MLPFCYVLAAAMGEAGWHRMIDPDVLVAPFADAAPSGIDLRSGPLDAQLRSLQDAVRNARSAEQHENPGGGRNGAEAEWQVVQRLAADLIGHRSKDLTVAANLTEALARRDGLAGLAAGARVMSGLLDGFSDGLHYRPYLDRPGLDRATALTALVAELAGAEGRLLPVVRAAPLFMLPDNTRFTLEGCEQSRLWTARSPADREQAMRGLSPPERAEREQAPGGHLWDKVVQEARGSGAADLIMLRENARAALDAWQALTRSLVARTPDGQTATAPLAALLTTLHGIAVDLAPPAANPGEPLLPNPDTAGQSAPTAAPSPNRSGPVNDREDALKALEEIARFFRRTEPASPFAYAIMTLVRRARLSWPELAAEILPDKAPREIMLQRLGIQLEDLD